VFDHAEATTDNRGIEATAKVTDTLAGKTADSTLHLSLRRPSPETLEEHQLAPLPERLPAITHPIILVCRPAIDDPA
jgi:hypothetical protein